MGTDADEHRYFEGMAVAHVLGGLDESDGRVFRSHLLECSDCRAHVGELRALAHDLADAERDERRVRAAKAVETKRRDDPDEDDEDDVAAPPPAAARVPRLLALVTVLALVGLGFWNLQLRATIDNHEANADFVTEAAELLELGDEVEWTPLTSGIDARVKMQGDRVVLLVTGLDEDTAHAIYQVDEDEGVLATRQVAVEGDRLFYLVTVLDGVRHLVLTRTGPGSAEPSAGERVLEARLPRHR